ncbi:MATE family efflux transporter [Anoxynatronum buryatiense]|uniref:Efflux protein, MATE family n=1 Tax=Anoxynatronum buryatiense TaxID=489973 RepID=A0AA45WXK0_9CLOT|nr:MATE family efflux transporter [Anoxynatronum buryatiense]SMP62861.1 putative efflux protein, MATE family [Anoxynatronum buryatiense]
MKPASHHQRLGSEPILPLLFKLSVPGMISMTIQALYNVVDSFFVARISESALTALSIAFPVHIFLIAIATGTGVGTSSLISRLLGQQKNEDAILVAQHVLGASLVYGVLSAIAGLMLAGPLVRAFSNDPEVIRYGIQYTRIIMLGGVFLFTSIVANDILRGQGNTFLPMLSMMLGAITNIILDPLMIFGIGFFPRMEVTGAAVATVISKAVSCFFILLLLYRGQHQVKPKVGTFPLNVSILKSVYQVGLPSMFMQFLTSFMIGGLNMVVGTYTETAMAVTGVYFRLQSFVLMPVFGLTQGYIPIIGYNYGSGNAPRMKQALRYGLLTAFVITSIGAFLFRFFPQQLIGLFQPGPEMLAIGSEALTTISLGLFIVGPAIIGATTFQAIGLGLPSLALSFLRQMVLLLPFAWILGRLWGLSAVWYAFPLSEFIALVIMVFWLGRRLQKVFASLDNAANQLPVTDPETGNPEA